MASQNIAILEPFVLFGQGLSFYFTLKNEFAGIYSASSFDELARILAGRKTDLVVMDMLHPDEAAHNHLKRIRKHFPAIPVLLIVREGCPEHFHEYLAQGVKGFVFESEGLNALFLAVKMMLSGKTRVPCKVAAYIKMQCCRHGRNNAEGHENQKLSEREIEVLKLFCDGLTFKEVGERLYISPRTVEAHKRNIMEKLNIQSSAEMIIYAARNNYTTV